jgi:protein-S-isoprenylcysteine O-methyltransferase Ste14
MKATGPERLFGLLMGLSCLSWAILGLSAEPAESKLAIPRLFVTVLHVVVGIGFLVRGKLKHQASIGAMASAFPSILLGGLVWKFAPRGDLWPPGSLVLFGAGSLVAIAGVLTLRANFAILPAVRDVTQSGLYRCVRHPIYFGELLMVLGCCVAQPRDQWPWMFAFAALIAAVVIRVIAEERQLKQLPAYQKYSGQVRWRLLPGLW